MGSLFRLAEVLSVSLVAAAVAAGAPETKPSFAVNLHFGTNSITLAARQPPRATVAPCTPSSGPIPTSGTLTTCFKTEEIDANGTCADGPTVRLSDGQPAPATLTFHRQAEGTLIWTVPRDGRAAAYARVHPERLGVSAGPHLVPRRVRVALRSGRLVTILSSYLVRGRLTERIYAFCTTS